MVLLDQRILGVAILGLLGMLVTFKRVATGSILDRPQGNLLVKIVNIFNLISLLVVNPLAAILLITRRLAMVDPTHLAIGSPGLGTGLEAIGLGLYVLGYLLMAWALVTLGHNYQLGGNAPRSADEMVLAGPYRFVRHPMYSAALCISLGLACLVQSLAAFALFCVYLVLIIALIPLEEDGLGRAYDTSYLSYQRKVKKLVPLIY